MVSFTKGAAEFLQFIVWEEPTPAIILVGRAELHPISLPNADPTMTRYTGYYIGPAYPRR